jgi:glycosyltransferase involved in cell wall biosynthesis
MTTALVVSGFFPYDSQWVHGVYQRLGTQVQALAKVVDRIDCLFLVPVDQDCAPDVVREHEVRLRRLWSPAISLRLAPTILEDGPKSLWHRVGQGVFDFHAQLIVRPTSTEAAIGAVSAALDAQPDIILAHRLSSMCALMKIARQAPEKMRGVPLFFDLDDIEHVTLFRRLLHDPGWPAERLLLLQVPTLMLAEIQAMRLAAATFVCSEADRRYLARFTRSTGVQVVPNSITFPLLDDGDASEPLVLFVGAMGYRPNAQAADSLVQEIWPAVRAQVPAARLVIIGPGREHAASYHSADPSVTFAGFVDDLQSWYRRARVVCCPIYHGGGTRVKIIEAAAHAKAIVSTRLGAEGLNFEDGREIILRDAPAQLAEACVRLLADPHGAARLGKAALQKAYATYERAAVVDQLAGIFRAGAAVNLRDHAYRRQFERANVSAMPDRTRVSVVIPVYNAERYLEASVRSALASDLSELEIVIVDDGSTDRSAEIIREIADPRIVLIQTHASGGPARPRNIGIAHARAPYVALLDADDLIKPDKLSSAATALDRHPEAGFAFADFEKIDGDGRILQSSVIMQIPTFRELVSESGEDSWRLIPRSELERGLLGTNFIGTSGVILRKSVLSDIGVFDESLVYCEDRDLWFRLAHSCSALYREQIGHSYRVAPGSLTYKPTLRTARDRITVIRRERARRKTGRERRHLDRLIAENLATIGYEHRRCHKRFRSAVSFLQAFVTHPDIRWMRALVGSLASLDPQ